MHHTSCRSVTSRWPAETRAPVTQFSISTIPALGADTAISIFIASSTINFCPACTRWPASTAIFHTLAVTGEQTGRQPSGTASSGTTSDRIVVRRRHELVRAGQRPAFALGLECRLLAALEFRGLAAYGVQERVVIPQAELFLLDAQRVAAIREVFANFQQLFRADFVKPDLIEEAQQPRRRGVEGIPHLQRSSHELIAAGTFHSIYAHVRAADADRVLRRPGARRIVLRRHQSMPRIHRRGDRRAQVHVAQAQHEIVGVEHDAADVIDGIQAVDAADELDVAGAPGRIGPHGLHVLAYGQQRRRVFPGKRQVHDARWCGDVVQVGDLPLARVQRIEQRFAIEVARVVVDLQRSHAGSQVDDAREGGGAQLRFEGVSAEAQIEVEDVGAVLDEERAISIGAADHAGGAAENGFRGAVTPEAHQVAGAKLADFPQLVVADGGGAHETAEARTVGAEDDGHVAGEIHRAHRVRIVVDVGGVQPGFAAVLARPGRLGPDQADARPVGIVMHLPRRGEEYFDVFVREEIGRAVRAVDHADFPFVGVLGRLSQSLRPAGLTPPHAAHRRRAGRARRGRRSVRG